MLFPKEWLDSKAEDEQNGINREWATEVRLYCLTAFHRSIQTNIGREPIKSYRIRIAITRPQTFLGSISQMAAALTHHVKPNRLREISKAIPKVLILTGDEDHMVHVENSFFLKKHMPEGEFVQWEHAGHGLPMQYKKQFNALLERVFAEGRQRAENVIT